VFLEQFQHRAQVAAVDARLVFLSLTTRLGVRTTELCPFPLPYQVDAPAVLEHLRSANVQAQSVDDHQMLDLDQKVSLGSV
jgi:hypothetical protein